MQWMKKYNISGCHSRVLEKFSISSNHPSDKPHWLQYCHCAKLQDFRINLLDTVWVIWWHADKTGIIWLFTGSLIHWCYWSEPINMYLALSHTCVTKLWNGRWDKCGRTVIWSKLKVMLHTRMCKHNFWAM